ncbi:hypothetical protein SDRG_07947 [Saprolegnia diclina VS20]|uniref:FYVE-type domain-containing protein n=1 Tax=Saprolegnia diclina (strain VS20) TaxID=1156394 RepID=T0QLE4_SAPDV|nr:hypothetical protein SDRG_07947 [Saprolegnia diclina VS20]EQC34625.1 hypothetical protein SDRG_07947 [Saprolegnia diclina VS20]|eukprot:XP_008612031.1 hypothetical protein SDRG_07947 [Saprolegnia diclina VS20]
MAERPSRRWSILKDDLLHPLGLVPLQARANCAVCLRTFSFFRAKYNCSLCGHVICRSCVLRLPVQDDEKQQRVMACEACLFHEDETTHRRCQASASDVPLLDEAPSTTGSVSLPSSPLPPALRVSAPTRTTFISHGELVTILPPRRSALCTRCHRVFGVFRVQYTCRTCGDAFCGHCTLTKLALRPDGRASYDVVVCKTCVHISEVHGDYARCKALQPEVLVRLHAPADAPLLAPDDVVAALRLECLDVVEHASLIEKQRWVPTKQRSTCFKCNARVPFVMYKSHCPLCGEAFCVVCLHAILVAHAPGRPEMYIAPICPSCHTRHYDLVNRRFLGSPSDANSPGTPPVSPNASVMLHLLQTSASP